MTTEEQAAINGRITARLGYWASFWCSACREFVDGEDVWPEHEGELVPGYTTAEVVSRKCGHSLSIGADYFTDAAASRELVAWLATDDEYWYGFETELAMLLTDEQGRWATNPIRAMMTAPLETIAIAADAALQGKGGE